MKKIITTAVLIVAVVLTSVALSNKSTASKQAELIKINKNELVGRGFSGQKNDLSSAD